MGDPNPFMLPVLIDKGASLNEERVLCHRDETFLNSVKNIAATIHSTLQTEKGFAHYKDSTIKSPILDRPSNGAKCME